MKIIITENQLKLIKEDVSNKARQILIDRIKSVGFIETSKTVGGFDNLMEILNINSPMDFLHLFDDLDVVQSEEGLPDWTLFRYKPKNNLMIHNRKNKTVYIDYEKIWKPLFDIGLFDPDIKELIEGWLFEVYNLRGVTPLLWASNTPIELFEVYNLKK